MTPDSVFENPWLTKELEVVQELFFEVVCFCLAVVSAKDEFSLSTNYNQFGSMNRVPENVSFLAASANTTIPLSELRFKYHPNSQHITIDNFQPHSYCEDYLMTVSYSQKIQDLQRSQMETLALLHASDMGLNHS